MTTIKRNYLKIISDSMNQTFNVVYPVRPSPVRGPVCSCKLAEFYKFLPLTGRRGAEV